tara:strand:+ start:347 stop:724 length:378 start_codon:yes stop_codon:yes gene_type:complete
MNKVEQIENHFQVVSYNGDKISKKYNTFEKANNKLQEINKSKTIHADHFELNAKAWQYAVDDITLVKQHGAVCITDTKSGVVFIEYSNNFFSMRFGEQRLITDNELMVVDIMKGLYTWEVKNTLK